MPGKKGVSVIVGTVLLIVIAIGATAALYMLYAPQLVPTVDSNKMLENIAIVKVDVTPIPNSADYNFALYVLNKGSVDVAIDRLYIEDLYQNWEWSQPTGPTPIAVESSQLFTYTVTGIFNDNETKILKAVTSRGTAATLLYAPPTEVGPEEGNPPGTGTNSTDQFAITVFKFDDANINGVYDAGDSPIGGWRFTIKNAITGTQVPAPTPPSLLTNASGYCTFTNLNKGYYLIEEPPQVRNGSFQWFNSTSSSNLVEINSRNETVNVGNYLVEWRYTLSGYVFNDITPSYGNGTYGNGIKDGADTGLSDWTIIYLRITGIPQLGVTKSDINGFYQFNNLANGIYIVSAWQADPTQIWIPTNPNPNYTTIVDASPPMMNFSFYQVASNVTQYYYVSGLVFNDTPVGGNLPDGIYNPLQGDKGIANVTLLVYNGSVPYISATTNSTGYFNIKLVPGIYAIAVEPNWNDWDPTTPSSYVIDVTSTNQSRQFGLYYNPLGAQPLYITGIVFNDTNGDGFLNATEAGVPNINVYQDTTSVYVSTDVNGIFLFDNQPKGNYTIFLDNATMKLQLPGYIITTIQSKNVTLNTSPVGGIEFGVYKVGVVYGWAYYDLDGIPGFNSTSDFPLKDVTILLNGTISTRTDANGLYVFDSLTPGIYEVQEIPLDQWNCTSQRVVVGNNYYAPMVVNFTNEPLFTLRFKINGTIFLDDDQDGVNDIAFPGGDSPYQVFTTIYAKYTSGSMAATASTTTGAYTLSNLAAGEDYYIYVNITGYTFTTPQTVLITNLNTNRTVDFGIYRTGGNATYTISGIKYNDTAPYGVFNTGDKPLSNWGVYLWNGTNTLPPPFAMNYTSNGNFFFDNITPGVYTLVELVEPGWANMTASVVSFNLTDHVVVYFFNNYTAFTNVTSLYNISGVIFNDVDNSGTYTIGDSVMSGQLVVLNDRDGLPIDFTSSNTSGIYVFTNLQAGNYSLRASVPSGYTNTTPYFVPVINLSSNRTINFGFRGATAPIYYAVDGYVWDDNNQNQVFDKTESGLPGWIVYLYGGTYSPYFGTYFPGPVPIASTTTDSRGYYYFLGLSNVTYSVVCRLNVDYQNTTPREITFTISGASYVNASFGNKAQGGPITRYISGFKYNDSDISGTYTTGETKLNNWTIWLFDSAGFPIRSVVSNTLFNSEYYFNFTGLPNGGYTVVEQLSNQAGWTNSSAGVVNVTISGASNSSITFGNRQLSATPIYLISGYVFNDTNRNNIFDDGNATMTDVWAIFLYSGAYSPYTFPMRITTTTNGQYTFSGLGNGVYTVVEVLKANYTNLWTRAISVTISGASQTNQSFFNKWVGPQPVYLVYGYKYNDTDLDQIWNTTLPDEAALSGWQIGIYDSFGYPLASTTTTSAGYYSFLVPNGAYTLAENLTGQPIWTYSTAPQKNITVTGAPVRYDFGNYLTGKAPAYSIYGWIFNDTNKNKLQDTGEVGFNLWTVTLKNGTTNATMATVQTNATGFYIFPSLSPGYYRVVSTAKTTEYTNSSDYIVNVTTTTYDLMQNFSWYYNYTPPVPQTISGRVYNLVNTAGNGLAGWTVMVNNGTYTNSKLTDSTGNYSFTLSPGTYSVQAIIMSGYMNITPSILNVTVSGPQIADFGMALSPPPPQYTVKGLKFNDLNKNGVNNTGELGITNWGFILYNSTDIFTSFTDSSGIFTFNGLKAGTYTVNETSKGGWVASNWTSININVTANGTFLYFGNYYNFTPGANYSVSGYVFNDVNRDAVYGGSDVPLTSWLMTLSDYQGTIIDSMLTDASGKYNFTSLSGGNYTVRSWYDSGAGWVNSTPSAVNMQIINSSITNLNFGYYYDRYNISGYVFFDSDKNGAYRNLTVSEYPLDGWTVILTNALGDTQVATTDSRGFYIFAAQPPGIYTVTEVIQSGWNTTNSTAFAPNVTNNTSVDFGNKRWFYGQFLTFDRMGWSSDTSGYLQNNFTTVYSSGVVTIGSTNRNQWDNLTYIKGYLANPTAPGYLDGNYSNPNGLGAGQGGILGANLLALKFNIDYDTKDIGLFDFGPSETLLSSLRIFNYSSAVDGKTIGQILAEANSFIGTGVGSMTADQYNALLDRINKAFVGPNYTDATYFIY